MEFVDRLLKCSDCSSDFVFTAGEQLFFFDKQFKNDPKRCKLCKAKRAGLGRTAGAALSAAALPLSRTETRTMCSACGVETTVPFKPTQGRPVLCRSCFQMKRVPAAMMAVANLDAPAEQVAMLEQSMAEAAEAGAMVSMTLMTGGMQSVTEAPQAVLAGDAGISAELLAAAADAAQA